MFLRGDSKQVLSNFADNTFDLIVTDPPYGISFMGKDWDKALPDLEVWKQCFRVLKEGKLAFIMCSPRQDVLSRMIINLETAGFRTNYTSIYWTYASGFPKAANVSKLIDKRNGREEDKRKELAKFLKNKIRESGYTITQLRNHLNHKLKGGGLIPHWITEDSQPTVPTMKDWNGLKEIIDLGMEWDWFIERTEAEREIIGKDKRSFNYASFDFGREWNITKPATDEAKKMEGAYVGFQPKPAVEVILVVSKGKTLTWLDDCRIPYHSEQDKGDVERFDKSGNLSTYRKWSQDHGYDILKKIPFKPEVNQKGRFPANLLVSDDVLNDGSIKKSGFRTQISQEAMDNTAEGYHRKNSSMYVNKERIIQYNDSGSYSRYFSLDAWSKTFPFIITPKASKSERNKGCEDLEGKMLMGLNASPVESTGNPRLPVLVKNHHPTVKPLKLFSYLITMGSREGDLVLDPFIGSGTTYLASVNLHRECIGIELNPEYLEIARARVKPLLQQTKLEG